jgi:hypothetical protein
MSALVPTTRFSHVGAEPGAGTPNCRDAVGYGVDASAIVLSVHFGAPSPV